MMWKRMLLLFAGLVIAFSSQASRVSAAAVDCSVTSSNELTKTCGETGVKLRVDVNANVAGYTLHLGVGAKTNTYQIQSPEITVSLVGQCVDTVADPIAPIGVASCGIAPSHEYHTAGSFTVASGLKKTTILATVNIDGTCPSSCTINVPISWFHEKDADADTVATWNTANCTGANPPTLTDPQEALSSDSCDFEITCVEKEKSEGIGTGSATGKTMGTYTNDAWAPGITRLSFDMMDAEPSNIDTGNFEFYLGSVGGGYFVGSENGVTLDYNQFHVDLLTAIVASYESAGVLQYYVTTEDSELVFESSLSLLPSSSDATLVLLVVLVILSGAGYLLWQRTSQQRTA